MVGTLWDFPTKSAGIAGQVFTTQGPNLPPKWTDKGSVSVPNLTLDDLTLGTQGDGTITPIKGNIDVPSGVFPPSLEIGPLNATEIKLGSTTSTLQIKSQL